MSGTGDGAPYDGPPGYGGGDGQNRSQGPDPQGPGPHGVDPDATHQAWRADQPHPNAHPGASPDNASSPAPQHNGQFGASPYGGPGSPARPGGHTAPGGPTGMGGPPGSVGPDGPQTPGRQPSPGRRWALIAVAFGCIAMLLLVIGGGVLYLTLQRDGGPDSTAAPSDPESTSTQPPEADFSTDPAESTFVGISPLDTVEGDADDVWAVMANNPLTTGSLPDVSSCEIPETPVEQSVEELQATLDAANDCLDFLWSSASSDRGLPWDGPSVQVYTYPDIPSSPCEPDTFEEDFPRVCNLDFTIYWPAGYGTGAEQTDPAAVPGAYAWDLSYQYMNTLTWNSSLAFYFNALDEKLADDPERAEEAWRRYNLQMRCLAAASTMQLPAEAQPTPEMIETLLDESTWPTEDEPHSLEPASRVHWLTVGLESDGDVAQCNTWLAPSDQVA